MSECRLARGLLGLSVMSLSQFVPDCLHLAGRETGACQVGLSED